MSVLAVIPARGGSKGIPGKNIKQLCGKPLIAWTIDVAKKAKCIDQIVVSSDDKWTLDIAKSFGVSTPFVRPPELATDDTPGILPILHAIDQLPGYDWILVLQPTSPLRTAEDIEGIFSFCMEKEAPAAVSICKSFEQPHWMYQKTNDCRLLPLISDCPQMTRRQDLPSFYVLNGALYLAKTEWLKTNETFISDETVSFEMPRERSVDIDEQRDWDLAESFLCPKC